MAIVTNPDGTTVQIDDSTIQPIQKTGAIRSLGDTLLKFGRSGVGATKAIADVVGAGNRVSNALQSASDFIGSGLSDEAKFDEQVAAQRAQNAAGKGAMAEIGATLRNFYDNPIDTVAEGAGSIIPTAAAMIASRGKINPAAAGIGLGAVQGAGAVKGSIYDAVKQDATAKGMTEQQADKLATDAQAYGGKNRDQIALGAGLGAVAGATGAEVTSLLTGSARETAKSRLRETLKGFATEGGTEAAQGGQEQYAANVARNRLGAGIDPFQGVAGQATAEGIAGGVVGGAFSLADTFQAKEQLKSTILQQGNGGVISQAAGTAIDTGAVNPELWLPGEVGPIQPKLTADTGAAQPMGSPNYVGEPLVTFPDGTTMTRAEAQAKYTADELAQFEQRVGMNQKPEVAGLLQTREANPMIVFADGSTGAKQQFDEYLAGLPNEAERMKARARFLGYAPQQADATQEQSAPVRGLLQASDQDPMIVYPDGSTGKRSEFDGYINSLPEQQRVTEMARLLGYGPQQGGENATQQPVAELAAQSGQEELANAQTGAGNELSATGSGAGLGADAATLAPGMRGDIPAGTQPRAGSDAGNATAGADVASAQPGDVIELNGVQWRKMDNGGFEQVMAATPTSDPQVTRDLPDDLPAATSTSNPTSNPTSEATGELPSNPQQLVGNSDNVPNTLNNANTASAQTLSPTQSAKLQEAHKALGRDVTKEQVQRMRDRVANEIATGKTSNGGVMVSLKPSAIEERKKQLARLDADLSLFGETAPNNDITANDAATSVFNEPDSQNANSINQSVDSIAKMYAQQLAKGRQGVSPEPTDYHYKFANAINEKNAYALEFLANGLNDTGKKVFSEATGVKLPRTQQGTWAALLEWAGINPKQDEADRAKGNAEREKRLLKQRNVTVSDEIYQKLDQQIKSGFRTIQTINGQRYLTNGTNGINLSKRGSGWNNLVDYIKERIAYENAMDELAKTVSQPTQGAQDGRQVQGQETAQEVNGVRSVVEAIVKRRAAANQIGKGRAFNNYLDKAKRMMAGETLPKNTFKLAQAAFQDDKVLADQFKQLDALMNKQPDMVDALAQAETAPAQPNKTAKQAETKADSQGVVAENAPQTDEQTAQPSTTEIQPEQTEPAPAEEILLESYFEDRNFTPIQKTTAKKTLEKQLRLEKNGETKSQKEWIDSFAKDGKLSAEIIKLPTLPEWNQLESPKKIEFQENENNNPDFSRGETYFTKWDEYRKANELKNEYQITYGDLGTFIENKTTFEYAQYVLSKVNQTMAEQGSQAAQEAAAAEEVTQTETTQKTVKTATESKPNQEKIQDFGEKIGGARKDLWSGFKDKMQQSMGEDVAAVPLAKSWPEPDYQGMIDAGADSMMVAHLRALRDAVPTKPKAGWKLKGWAQKVKALRDIAYSITQDGASFDKLRSELADFAKYARNGDVAGISDLADLYWRVGHEKSLKGIRVSVGTYSVYAGVEYKPAKTIWSVEKDSAATSYSNWPNQLATGATKEEAISNFAKAYKTLEIAPPVAKQVSFDIYTYRTKPGKFIIGKKAGKSYIDLKEFDSLKDAREYRANNQDELVKLLAKAKEIPNERNAENNPRVGADHRKGADVTPQAFAETFGFRGVEFGNYVENDKRQQDLNEAYDALMDMAGVLNIPAKAISLNGELGIAFGARGSGGKRPAKAHYESGHIVINLTKNKGAGSLGHEWWHALDNYFSRMRGKSSDFTTETNDVAMAASGLDVPFTGNVRKEMIQAFGDVVKAIKSSSLRERSKQLDKTRTKDYWSTMLEMTARSFESYLISKLQDQGASNDYLANIVTPEAWGMESSYPYPTAGELPAIREAYDNFFNVVETKESDDGNVAMFSRTQRSDLAPQSDLDALAALFTELETDKKLRKLVADRKVDKHPMADEIKRVDRDFYDIIGQLEDEGRLKINCKD